VVTSAGDGHRPQLDLIDSVDWGEARGGGLSAACASAASMVHDGVILRLQGGGMAPLGSVSRAPRLTSHSDADLGRMAAQQHWLFSKGLLGQNTCSRWV
jgi:hypothetical protein